MTKVVKTFTANEGLVNESNEGLKDLSMHHVETQEILKFGMMWYSMFPER